LASSTAVTLHLSRLGRQSPELASVASSGILIACGTMFIRMLIVVAILAPSQLPMLWPPIILMALITYLPLLRFERGSGATSLGTSSTLQNPLEIKTALTFGAILTAVMLLSVVLKQTYGDAGLMTLAAVSGIADVDAIMLSMIGMSDDSLTPRLFVMGCVIAAAMNSVVKALMCMMMGGRVLSLRAALPLFMTALAGLISLAIWYW
jgi:uncharacterized membrane protein (DUF4010 family)